MLGVSQETCDNMQQTWKGAEEGAEVLDRPTHVPPGSSLCLFQKFKMSKHFGCNTAHPVNGHSLRLGDLACYTYFSDSPVGLKVGARDQPGLWGGGSPPSWVTE